MAIASLILGILSICLGASAVFLTLHESLYAAGNIVLITALLIIAGLFLATVSFRRSLVKKIAIVGIVLNSLASTVFVAGFIVIVISICNLISDV